MGFGSHFVNSLGWCFSTKYYNDWINKHCHDGSDDDDEKIVPDWFYLPYCDEIKKYMEFTKNKCSQYLSHRNLVICNYCENDFRTFSTGKKDVHFVVG